MLVAGLGRAGLSWAGLGWAGLGWAGLGWVVQELSPGSNGEDCWAPRGVLQLHASQAPGAPLLTHAFSFSFMFSSLRSFGLVTWTCAASLMSQQSLEDRHVSTNSVNNSVDLNLGT